MRISEERLNEIKNFPETFTDPECPPLTKEQLALFKPIKKTTTIRLDADSLHYLQRSGKGWQTRVNEYIRKGIASGQL